MPRLFIALELPEEAKDQLADLTGDLPGADWTLSENYHLTLRFLGEVDSEGFAAIREGLGGIQSKAFHLDLRGLGVFPLRGDPETLWTGADRNESLQSLRNKVESLVVRRGQPPESRKFHPHVTLAKVRSVGPEWIGAFVAENGLFSVRGIPVRSFGLFSSERKSWGPEYTLEERYMLEGILDGD